MSDKDVEIDPRFDPAFQRGFDQSIPIEEFVPAPLPRTAAAPTRFSPTPTEQGTVAGVPVDRKAGRPEPELVIVNEDEDSESASEPAVESDLESSPSRNPFLLFLLIIAIALVAAGIWLFVRSGDAFNSREVPSQGDFMSLTATLDAAPFIALLGAATAIGVLFVFASKWRKRR